MISKENIAAIIVLFNPNQKVYENIKKYIGLVGQIVLVDNSSYNNKDIFKGIKNCKYIPLFDNKGIAYALNKGIKDSTEAYVLTMDQDSSVSPSLIENYINFLNINDSRDIGALTCQYNTDRNPRHAKKGFETIELSMQSGSLFKRNVFNKIGYFNEDLFLDVVDYEFFIRMKKAGIKLIRVNSAVLTHHPATTRELKMGRFKFKYGVASPVRYYYQARNLLWTAKKYHSKKLYIILMIKWLKILLLFNNKSKYFDLYYQGILDSKSNNMGKYNEKKNITS